LWRYRQDVDTAGAASPGLLTALAGAAYFFVWTIFGIAAFPVGVALATIEMQQPALAHAVPIATSVVVLMAGSLQFTTWKARQLACCRDALESESTVPAAWRHGLHLGVRCVHGCANLMAILLVVGVMDVRAMAVVTTAITVERLAPAGERAARAIGAALVAAALIVIARTTALA